MPHGENHSEVFLFVYGTLRTEYAKVGERVCGDRLRGVMFDLGGAPGFFGLDSENYWVVGEVLKIPEAALPTLDRYEGVMEGLYTREEMVSEKGHSCYVYQINPGLISGQRIVQSGDWLDKDEPSSDTE